MLYAPYIRKYFCSTYTIFDKELFPKCTDSYTKEYKLYNKLLNKISPEIELLVPGPSRKNRPTPIPILHISIPSIQNNPPTHFLSPSLSYKFSFLLLTPRSRKLIVEIKEMMMLTLILRCNLLYKYHKILN